MIIGGHILLFPKMIDFSSDFVQEWLSIPSDVQADSHSVKFVIL